MPEATQQPWKPLPFDEAVAFFKSKVPLTPDQAKHLTGQATERAFVIGGLTRNDLVADVLTAMQKAIANGTTIYQFRKDIAHVIAEKGWTGPADWRVQTIFRTNVQSAYGAGKWAQLEQAGDAVQVVVYDAVGDARTRPSHMVLDGKAFAKDDPIWQKWWPPNGFNCRCTVRLMSASEARARGVTVESGAGIARGESVAIGPGRDQVIAPDPGFGGNPGRDFLVGLAAAAMKPSNFTALPGLKGPKDFGLPESIADMPAGSRFPWPAAELLPPSLPAAEYVAAARARLGMAADQATIVRPDVRGDPVLVTEPLLQKLAAPDRQRWAVISAGVTDAPSEVWLVPGTNASGQVVLRRRYIKVFQPEPGHKTEGVIAIAELEDGVWKELSVHPKGADLNRQRQGELLYVKKEG